MTRRDHLLGFPPVLKLIEDAPPAANCPPTPAREKPTRLQQSLNALGDQTGDDFLSPPWDSVLEAPKRSFTQRWPRNEA